MIGLKELGFGSYWESFIPKIDQSGYQVARVISEQRERYTVRASGGEFLAEVTGKLRYEATDRTGFPVVGDWVTIMSFDNMAIIHEILPRRTFLKRLEVGSSSDIQPIASNVDVVFIMQSVGHDFNINRLDRYLSITESAGARPVFLLNKIDLVSYAEQENIIGDIRKRHGKIEVIAMSNETGEGLDQLKKTLIRGKTYCILGSSGVGKSTLINQLTGTGKLKTNQVSESTSKGKHTTSHRELYIIPGGAIIIDTPGMRELGLTTTKEDVTESFDLIDGLVRQCKYSDCTHTVEEGCALLASLEQGKLERTTYESYMKLIRETEHYQSTLADKRRKDKQFGRLYKQVLKYKKNTKFY